MTTRTDLKDPWIWIPFGVAGVVTELIALRTGRTPFTGLCRWALTSRWRYLLMAWEVVTGCHIHGWPPQFVRVDPYRPLGLLVAPREVPRIPAETLEPLP